ncbi:MAG: response regulator transcription factor [Bacteroidales bacterium]|nr:response regulator transcription factor [Bacteroidales bacterium]MCF8458008.1 response regulator transcription factor [Bacteroidales bacterium]
MKKFLATILLVEDDENLGFILKDYLEMIGYNVDLQKNGVAGLRAFKQGKFDLCILDVMMPLKDGFTLAAEIHEINKEIPIIFLTAKLMKEDKIKGLKLGADDYITKPFSSEELSLRIENILRRYKHQKALVDDEFVYHIGKFEFNFNDQMLTCEDDERRLTRKEADVLKLLCQYKNKLLRREIVLKHVWGKDDYFMGRSMDVYITKLRKYLKDDENVTIINVHGAGFKLEAPD